MKMICLLTVFIAFLTGCQTSNVQKYSEFSSSDKSITVPSGGFALLGPVKSALRENGWKLVVKKGPKVTEGSLGKKVRLEEYDTFSTRYTLTLWDRQVDLNVKFEWVYNYDLSIIDNKTGEEILNISGMDSASNLVKKLNEALK